MIHSTKRTTSEAETNRSENDVSGPLQDIPNSPHPAFVLVAVLAACVALISAEATLHTAAAHQASPRQCANGVAVPNPEENPGLMSDCKALLVSGDALAGSAYLDWSTDAPIEEWEGVMLGGKPLRVRLLDLQNRKLTGTVPPELGSLSNLGVLEISDNQLAGNIPPSLGNLPHLRELNLGGNQLVGPIPAGIGRLSELYVLELWDNGLSGPTPSELANLELWHLLLGNNQLTGEIPPWLGDLEDLYYLDLSRNRLTGEIPAGLGRAQRLGRLFLGGNLLTGCVPPDLRGVSDVFTDNEPDNDLHEIGLPFCDVLLSGITLDSGELTPEFDPYQTRYSAAVVSPVAHLVLTNEHAALIARVVPGMTIQSIGTLEHTVVLDADPTTIAIEVVSEDELATYTYTIKITWTGSPGTPIITDVTPGGGRLVVSWTEPAEPGVDDITTYDLRHIESSTAGRSPASWTVVEDLWDAKAGGDLTYAVTGLSAGTEYDVQVRAVIDGGTGPWSEIATGVPGSSCVAEGAVEDKAEAGLVSDCETLLVAGETLAGSASAMLDWSASRPIAEWEGVTVAGTPRRVTQLDLRGYASVRQELTGTVPPSLGHLTGLQRLYLGHNRLTGSIPPALASLSNLHELGIPYNRLTGELPPELGNLLNLRTLDLRNNQLSGSIPSELGNLANLEELGLRENLLSGEIPGALSNLTSLTALSLGGNSLTGTVPPWLANMTHLQLLGLDGNQLTGTIPPWLGSLIHLVYLSLADNQLTGTIPPELGSLTNLEYLCLGGNQLTGAIPPELGNLTKLNEVLDLSNNQLTGSIPPTLGSLSALFNLDLSNNRLTGPVPPELGSIPFLHRLFLNENLLGGPIPKELGGLSALVELDLSGNQLTGPIPPGFGSLTELYKVDLSENRLRGEIPVKLGDLVNLVELNLAENYLTGIIPPELGGLTMLRSLWLSLNQLSGCIPEKLRDVPDNDLFGLGLPFCDVLLSGITIDSAELTPQFEPYHTRYSAAVVPPVAHLVLTNEHAALIARVVPGMTIQSIGTLEHTVVLDADPTTIAIEVVSEDELATYTYTIKITWTGSPGTPVITDITSGGGSLVVSWTAPAQPGVDDIITYDLRYIESSATDSSPASWTVVEDLWDAKAGGDLTYAVTGLSAGTEYDVQVRAVIDGGTGPWSEIATGVPGSSCVAEGAVEDKAEAGLVSDCETLLVAGETLAGSASAMLDWSASRPIAEWEGVTVAGTPRRVTGLNLRGRGLTGTIAPELGRLTHLERLHLDDNNLTGPIPDLGGLASLKTLWLKGNELSGTIPSGLGTLSDLVQLNLHHNDLTGSIPVELGDLTNLEGLWLHANDLSGTIPAELGNLHKLKWLWLYGNELTGDIPAELNRLYRLVELNLHHNYLHGTIPAELGDLTNLEGLWLHRNELEGAIPPALGRLSRLEWLSLYRNAFDGEIPAELGGLSKLKRLYLHHNRLSGAIPSALGDLTALTDLWLNDNEFTGPIPFELDNLDNLQRIRMRDNAFTGCIPEDLAAVPNSDLDKLGLEVCD